MTDLLERAEAFVAKWQPRLHLGEWRIVVGLFADAGPASEACVSNNWKEFRAHLQLRADLPAWKRALGTGPVYAGESDDDLIELAVVHELVHLAQQPFGDRFDKELKEWIGAEGAIGSDTRTHWTDLVEAWTERTARVLIEADRGAWSSTAPVPVSPTLHERLGAAYLATHETSAPVAVNGGTTTKE